MYYVPTNLHNLENLFFDELLNDLHKYSARLNKEIEYLSPPQYIISYLNYLYKALNLVRNKLLDNRLVINDFSKKTNLIKDFKIFCYNYIDNKYYQKYVYDFLNDKKIEINDNYNFYKYSKEINDAYLEIINKINFYLVQN